jgi:hypothetical protein
MKGLIRLLSQLLTILFIGYILALLKQKSHSLYYAIFIPITCLLSFFVGAFFSVVLGGSNTIVFIRELQLHWYWYIISFGLCFYLFDKIVNAIQMALFSEYAKSKFSRNQFMIGLTGSLLLLTTFYLLEERFVVPFSFLLIAVLAFYLFRSKNDSNAINSEVTEFILNKVGDIASKGIKEREEILKNEVYNDPKFRAFASKYNMSEDEFVEKVKSYTSKDPQRYTKLLKYDVGKTRWSKFF